MPSGSRPARNVGHPVIEPHPAVDGRPGIRPADPARCAAGRRDRSRTADAAVQLRRRIVARGVDLDARADASPPDTPSMYARTWPAATPTAVSAVAVGRSAPVSSALVASCAAERRPGRVAVPTVQVEAVQAGRAGRRHQRTDQDRVVALLDQQVRQPPPGVAVRRAPRPAPAGPICTTNDGRAVAGAVPVSTVRGGAPDRVGGRGARAVARRRRARSRPRPRRPARTRPRKSRCRRARRRRRRAPRAIGTASRAGPLTSDRAPPVRRRSASAASGTGAVDRGR